MRRLTVFIDGECPLCVEGAVRFKKLDKRAPVMFVNLHEPRWSALLSERFSEDTPRKLMVAKLPDGTWRTGYFAWTSIFSVCQRTRIIGVMMGLPIFYDIGPRIYGYIANHRIMVSRVLRLPAPCDDLGLCRLQSGASID